MRIAPNSCYLPEVIYSVVAQTEKLRVIIIDSAFDAAVDMNDRGNARISMRLPLLIIDRTRRGAFDKCSVNQNSLETIV